METAKYLQFRVSGALPAPQNAGRRLKWLLEERSRVTKAAFAAIEARDHAEVERLSYELVGIQTVINNLSA